MTALPRLTATGQFDKDTKALIVVTDDETRDAFVRVLEETGVDIQTDDGGIDLVVDYLAQGRVSPPLLVVDVEDVDDPLGEIDRLADLCHPGTSVIAVGRQNDVNLFRRLVGMGVADYLIKPVSAADVEAAVANALRPPEAARGEQLAKPGRLAVVIGARGGTGASTLAVNAAWLLSQRPDQKVALIDLDLHFGTASFALDLEPGRGLRDALENPDRVDSLFISSVAVPANDRLSIFGSEEPLDGDLNIDPGALDLLIAEVRREFRTVVIDLPRHMLLSIPEVLSDADIVYIVSDLSLTGMRDTMRLLTSVKNAASEAQIKILVNRAASGGGKGAVTKADFEKGIDHKIDRLVPEDAKSVGLASSAGRPLAVAAKSSKVVAALREIADEIAGRTNDKSRSSIIKRLFRKS